MTYEIRQATARDVPLLGEVERAAAVLFPAGRIPDADQVTAESDLNDARADGLLFVADRAGAAIGFATCSIENGHLHLDELAVHPDHGRRGVGRRLVEKVIEEAERRELAGVSLTTFADLPWNGPFYAGMGFRSLGDDELSDFLRDVLALEVGKGLTRRVAMIRRTGTETA